MVPKIVFLITKGTNAGAEYVFDQTGEVSLGRDPNNTIVIADPAIDGVHFLFNVVPPEVSIQQTKMPETYLNGEYVQKVFGLSKKNLGITPLGRLDNSLPLLDGDVLRFGEDTELVIKIVKPAFCVDCDKPLLDDEPKYKVSHQTHLCCACKQKRALELEALKSDVEKIKSWASLLEPEEPN